MSGLALGAQLNAQRTMRRALVQDIADQSFIGESKHIIEVLRRVLWVTTSVGPADGRDRARLAEQVTDRVDRLRRAGEGAHEEKIRFATQLLGEVRGKLLRTRVTAVADRVAGLLTPCCDRLRHDACEVRVHQPRVEETTPSVGGEIEDRNVKTFQRAFPF